MVVCFPFVSLKLETKTSSSLGFAVLCAAPEVARKTRILNVVYNASNNELVRTNTLVKNSIVHIDATPFKAWWVLKCK